MDEDQIIGRVALVISLIAFFGVLGVGCYAYFGQPAEVDLSGIADNRIDIDKLLSDMNEMQKDIDDMPLVEVTEEDLEDLEDNIKDLEEDIEDCAEDNPLNITELTNCLKKL